MRQTVKNIVVAATAIAATATVIQVARANFLPQAIADKELQQLQSAGIDRLTGLLQLKPDDSAAPADMQEIKASDLLQPIGPVAFIDLQQQLAFSYSPLEWDLSPISSFDNADAVDSLAEMPHLASLEQPQSPEILPRTQDLGLAPKRDDSLEPSRGTDRSPARQRGVPISRIQFDVPTLAPVSHTFFCLKYRDDCKVDKTVSSDSTVLLSSDRWAELERINAAVNRAIIPQPNTRGLAGEVWLISPRAGECHDYAVTKRHELLALGWPEQDLLLSEVVTSWGEHHLVLVIRTSDGDFVADNLNSNIRIWSQTPYQWVRIQSPGNPLIWSTLANARVAARARTRVSGQADAS